MVMWYWSVAILFWQLSSDHVVNVQYKRCTCGFARTRVRHPSAPFDSLPYPTRIICIRVKYVRTYARSITWQPNEKRLSIFYEYGALSHARFALRGSPSIRQYYIQTINATFYYFNLLTVGVLLAISYKYILPRFHVVFEVFMERNSVPRYLSIASG